MPAEKAEAASPSARRYCTFVDPGHPLVDLLFPLSMSDEESILAGLLKNLRERSVYIGQPGHRTFDALQAQPRDSQGRLELNCINMICLLVSGIRRAGIPADRPFVVLAGARGYLTYHAWALWARSGEQGYWWIDPIDLVPKVRQGRELLAGYDIYAVFNDSHLAVTAEEKRNLLLGTDL